MRIAARDLKQALRLQALLPERRSLTRPTTRDEQRTRCVLAEAGAVERAGSELAQEQVLDLVRVGEEVGDRRRHVRVWKVKRDAVVRPQGLHVHVERVAETGSERHRPGCVHAAAEGREHADAPVPDLVAETLDDDRPIGRDDSGRALLLPQEGQKVSRGALVEPVLRLQEADRVLVVARDELATRPADPLTELGRTADALALPEGRNARHAGGGRDEHSISRDLLDPPGRCAEQERLPRTCLVHHLLVELADPPAAVDEEDPEETSIRNRARVRHGQPPRPGPASHDAGRPIPDDSRTKLRELVGRIAPGEHVEDVLELRP